VQARSRHAAGQAGVADRMLNERHQPTPRGRNDLAHDVMLNAQTGDVGPSYLADTALGTGVAQQTALRRPKVGLNSFPRERAADVTRGEVSGRLAAALM
jgi:hypothetical protein